jgi:hypothetical protein
MLRLEFGPKTADKKSSEDGGCVETTAVIHRTHWVEHECSGSVCFVFGRIGSYVAVCPSLVFSSLHQLVERIIFMGRRGQRGQGRKH